MDSKANTHIGFNYAPPNTLELEKVQAKISKKAEAFQTLNPNSKEHI